MAPAYSGSQGTAFAQKRKQSKKGEEKKASDKPQGEKKDFEEYFKDKPCFKCGKKGHPQLHCPMKDNGDNVSSISSRSCRTSKLGRKPKNKDFKNQFKNLKSPLPN